MIYFKRLSLYVTIALSFQAFSQTVVREDNMTATYFKDSVRLLFDGSLSSLSVNSFDAETGSPIEVTKDAALPNAFVLHHTFPAEIIKVGYKSGQSGNWQTAYLASPSTSSGTINVYFNHPVNTAYSQGQDAINLSNTLDNKLIEYINGCNLTLDIAIYNSSSPSATTNIAGAINAAYTRGVQVRVIYDGSTSGNMISLLNAGIPKLASPTTDQYGIMHNKFVVFDADSSDPNVPIVWTGSTNWTQEQIEGPDKNSAIIIQDQALAAAYKIEFQEMWGGSAATPNLANSKFGPFKTDNTPHNFVINGKQVNCYFSPSDNTNAKIIAAINSANSDIEIATMLITRTDIANAILNKYNSGVTNINLVVDNQNPTGNKFPQIQAGVLPAHAVVCNLSGIMHHKFMVVDNFNGASDPQVVVGSHNWSTAAQNYNDENTLIVHDASVANQYYQAFAYLYQQAGGTIVLGTEDFIRDKSGFLVYPNPFRDAFTIENSGQTTTGAVVKVYDMLGHEILTKDFSALSKESIDLSAQAAGVYFVQVQTLRDRTYFRVIKK